MRRSTDQPPDEELRHGLASDPASKSHRRAVEWTLRKYCTELERYFARRLGVPMIDVPHDGQVQDLMHHVWLVLNEKPRHIQYLRAYLYQILKSELAKVARAARAIQHLDTCAGDGLAALRAERPDVAMILDDEEIRLREFIGRLWTLPNLGVLPLTRTQ